jgi:hypothetical protein
MIPSRFKNAIKPNVGESWTTLYAAPAGTASLVLQINGSIEATAALIGSARVFDSSTGTYSYLIKNAPIPQGDAIRLIDQAKIVLEEGDRIEVKCESPAAAFKLVLAGTVSSVSNTVTGVGTSFLSTVSPGSILKDLASGQERRVVAVSSDVSLTVDLPFSPALDASTVEAEFDETIDYIGSLIEDVNDTSIGFSLGTYKNSVISSVGEEWSALYETPAGMTTFVLQINAANTSESGVQVSVRLLDASENTYATVLDGAQVPIADAIRLIDHAKIVLEEGDRLEVKCSTPGETVDLVASIIQDVNRSE